jgi:3' terminal RNA ribose 2'-O-methyltransferase Hen1
MLLTITSTHRPAGNLGYLLHKHPGRFQSFELSFGQAHVFYPEVGDDSCTACLLIDVDPIGMVRGQRSHPNFLLAQYVNDRPYAASSFMSVAISQVLGSAMGGRCPTQPELVETPLPLVVQINVLPVRGGEQLLNRIFEPLGYDVEATRAPLDERFPEWGESPYYSVTIRKTTTLRDLLAHLYVLMPIFDNQKHYFVGEDELEKLLRKGEGWLADHPEKEEIARRYLKHRPNLYRTALARLAEVDDSVEPESDARPGDEIEAALEQPQSLNEQRIGTVLAALRASGAKRVLDLGCGEGKLLRELLQDRRFERIVGLDVSLQTLQRAVQRLGYDRLPSMQKERIELIHGSLMYRDKRLQGFEAASVVEVIEHFDPPRLKAFERVLFEFARPRVIVLTTPNQEYNVMWKTLPAGKFRHPDHRFEWTRAQFHDWGYSIADRFGYTVRFLPVGPEVPNFGSPTQMGVFELH